MKTVDDQLKSPYQIEYSLYRSVSNLMMNIMVTVVAYCLPPDR